MSTLWPEVLKLSIVTTTMTIKKLWVLLASYGFPKQIVTDNGSLFTSEEFEAYIKKNGIKHTRCASTIPHPRELWNVSIRPLNRLHGLGTLSHLSAFFFTYHSTLHAKTNRTPSSLFLQCEVPILTDPSVPSFNVKSKPDSR